VYFSKMFARSRRIDRTLEGIEAALNKLSDAHHAPVMAHPGGERLEALEQRVRDLESNHERAFAEAQALQLKATATFNSARAAEERTKRYAEQLEHGSGEGDESGDEEAAEALRAAYAEAGLPLDDGRGGEESGVHPMRDRMAPRRASQAALQAKWAR
jgi:flagellar biosynthesis/type III secretory pathway protein FliH